MPAPEKLAEFTPQVATVYLGGSRHPFRPGDVMQVPESHLADLKAHDDRAVARVAEQAKAAEAAAAAEKAKSAAGDKADSSADQKSAKAK